jgi:hypothetical protein
MTSSDEVPITLNDKTIIRLMQAQKQFGTHNIDETLNLALNELEKELRIKYHIYME